MTRALTHALPLYTVCPSPAKVSSRPSSSVPASAAATRGHKVSTPDDLAETLSELEPTTGRSSQDEQNPLDCTTITAVPHAGSGLSNERPCLTFGGD
ncbi:hypothetical protein [Streptomyces sp. ATMOS53]